MEVSGVEESYVLNRRTVRLDAIGGAEGDASRDVARCEYNRGIRVGVRDLGGGLVEGEVEDLVTFIASVVATVAVRADGEPAIVGRLALTDSCNLLTRFVALVGVTADAFDDSDEAECEVVRESTRLIVLAGSAEICIGGSCMSFGSFAIISAELRVCKRNHGSALLQNVSMLEHFAR